MPHRGGKKRNTPRKAYAKKARQKLTAQGTESKNKLEGHTKFSMIDTARNTGKHNGIETQGLRHSRINFVSASSIDTSYRQDALTTPEGEGIETDTKSRLPLKRATNNDNSIERQNVYGTKEKEATDGSIERANASQRDDQVKEQARNSNEAPGKDVETASYLFRTTGGDTASRLISRLSLEGQMHEDHEEDTSETSEDIVVFTGRAQNRTLSQQRQLCKTTNYQRCQTTSELLATHTSDVESEHLRGRDQITSFGDSDLAKFDLSGEVHQHLGEDLAADDYIMNLLENESLELELDEGSLKSDGQLDRVKRSWDFDQWKNNEMFNDVSSESDSVDFPDDSRLQRARTIMTDEELARRLAKQEELGLNSSEVMLWHEGDVADLISSDEDYEVEMLRQEAESIGRARKGRYQSSKLPALETNSYPVLDGHRNFDVMGFDRPSLQGTSSKKGRPFPFVLSDSELESNMVETWQKDRAKKKLRKQERERLRSENLLDIQMKGHGSYHGHEGRITMQQIQSELREFLQSDQTFLSLVPMDKRARRTIHELANHLNLRSKSKGSGTRRYPCLYKTASTIEHNQYLIDAIIKRYGLHRSLSRSFNHSEPMIRGKNTPRKSRSGITSGVTYREGETVGGAAPALDSNNRGHALLSKMGWTSGTALGAINNKGALEPVAHVVKVTRAGLG